MRVPRDVVTDAALGVAVTVAVGVAVAADLEPVSPRRPDAGAYVLPLALGAMMLVRRRWPVGVLLVSSSCLLVYYVAGYPAVGLALPLAGAVLSVAEAGRIRWAIGWSAFQVLFSTAYRVVEGGESLTELFGYELATTVALLAAVIALGDALRSRRGWVQETRRRELLAAEEREHESLRRVEAERLRIARELHDVLAHTLAVVTIQADVATEAVRDDPDAAEAALRELRGAGSRALGELRSTLGLLREPGEPGTVHPVPGLVDLSRIVGSAEAGGVAVRVVGADGRAGDLPATVDAAAQRIVQESLTNVLRHAGATRATVELARTPSAFVVRVSDDGHGGVPPEDGRGWGIRGMRERAVVLGGTLRAGPGPGGGFLVEAVLPVPAGPP